MIQEALQYVHQQLDGHETRIPKLGIILGSGLGNLADTATNAVTIETKDIPHYPQSTVEGHQGRWVFGDVEGESVLFMQGRVHFYEGHSIREVVFPIRLMHALGITHVIVTNAAGGINDSFDVGTIMFIQDHINLGFHNNLIGAKDDGGPRFPDMSEPYNMNWLTKSEQKALSLGIATRRGVYVWTQGPSYETKAEIKFFRTIGADAVGMSTVPEVIQAVYFGMKVLGISTITNMAAGMQGPLNHQEVMETGQRVRVHLERLICGIVQDFAQKS